MKKLFFLLAVVILSAPAFSQDRENLVRFGVKGGLNINKVDGKSFRDEFSYNYQVGAFLQLNLNKRFGIQPEINLAQVTAEQSDDATDIYDDIFLGGNQVKAKLSQLKIAGLGNLNVGPSRRVKLQFGPQWAMELKEDVDSLKENRHIFRDGEFSVLGGLMLQLPLVHIGGRYELGLTNINDIDNQDKWKRRAWQLFIGLTF